MCSWETAYSDLNTGPVTEHIDPAAIYTPREIGELTRVGYEEVLAAIVRGDLKARLKPPANRYRLVKGSDALAWFDTLPDA